MPVFSYQLELFMPLQRLPNRKKNDPSKVTQEVVLDRTRRFMKKKERSFALVIPGWVVATNAKEAKRHARLIGRGMLLGSIYNEAQGVYSIDFDMGWGAKVRAYWAVANVRECADGIRVRNAHGVGSVQLVPKKTGAAHPFLQRLMSTESAYMQ